MRFFPLPETKLTKVLSALFLTALLFLARDTLVTSSILGFNKSQFLMLGLLCAAGAVFLLYHRKNWKAILLDKRMYMIFLAAAVTLLPMLAKGDWQMMYLSVLLCLLTAVFFSYVFPYRELAKYYVLILTVLGVYSIIAMWILRPLLIDTGIVTMPVFFNQMDVMFHNFFLSFVSDTYVHTRNFGIFREPGVYQYFIILALFLNNYAVTWKKQSTWWICNIALAATMLTTLATGGVAELGVLALAVFFERKLYKDKRVLAAVVVFAVLLCVLVGYIVMDKGDLYWELYSMVLGKFQPGEDSAVGRLDAILMDLRFFLSSPLVGENLATVLHSVTDNTTSTMILYAGFGILAGTLNVIAWFALIWDRKRKLWVNLLLVPVMFLSFNTQNLIADVFFWLFPYMALTERLLAKKG